MQNVLTLIGNRALTPLGNNIMSSALDTLKEAGAKNPETVWLSPGQACDIRYEGVSADLVERTMRERLLDVPIDIAAQPLAKRRKRLLISDMDSTIIEQECIDEIASYIGLHKEVSQITESAMRGDIKFSDSLIRRAKMLKGLEVTTLHRVLKERITETPGAKTLVQTMRKHGAYTSLVSSGFTYFTEFVSKEIGFHDHQANSLEVINGRLTGQIISPILDEQAKLLSLKKYISDLGLTMAETLAVGDGANDTPMIQNAGLGIAFHAKPLVAASAPKRIDHGNLTSLLYLQGYRDEEFSA